MLSAWLVYRDPVLLQISQNMDLLKEEKGLHISVLAGGLKPWLELDLSRGSQIAGRLLNWQQEPLEALGQAVELLLERKNRVWARVFIQQLSSCVAINPKLSSWASQMNDAGQVLWYAKTLKICVELKSDRLLSALRSERRPDLHRSACGTPGAAGPDSSAQL